MRSTPSSTSAAITAPPASIEPPEPKPSRPGPRSPAWPLGHKPSCDWPSCAVSRPEPIKLTVPEREIRGELHAFQQACFNHLFCGPDRRVQFCLFGFQLLNASGELHAFLADDHLKEVAPMPNLDDFAGVHILADVGGIKDCHIAERDRPFSVREDRN